MVEAGLLRHRILIEQRATGANSLGEPLDTWSAVATVWGEVEALSGTEAFAARQLIASVSYKITIRHRSDLLATMRATLPSGAVLDIQSVTDPDGRKRETLLLCSDRQNRGAL